MTLRQQRHPLRVLALLGAVSVTACADRSDTSEPGASSSGDSSGTAADPPTSESDATSSGSSDSTDATTATGTSDSGSESDSGETGSTTTGPETLYSVAGVVTRSVSPSAGNDAIGGLYVSVVDTCDFAFELVAVALVESADLSGESAAVEWTVAGVPEGDWFFIAFLDDNEDAVLPNPQPGIGDLVATGTGGIGCTPFTVEGGDVVGVEHDLDFVLPF